MKNYTINLYWKEVVISQNDDWTFNKPQEILDYVWVWTSIKPAHEPICMARKPLAEKTVAENCLKYGTGGINIDESRVGTSDKLQVLHNETGEKDLMGNMKGKDAKGRSIEFIDSGLGRFPANLIHDNSEEVRECFPSPHGAGYKREKMVDSTYTASSYDMSSERQMNRFGDSGNASRFFKSIIYQAKASKSERNKGCEELTKEVKGMNFGGELAGNGEPINIGTNKNFHPTVKPIALMEYLIKMVTKEWYTVLDPFMWSWTTALACKNINRKFIWFELEKEYVEIANARIKEEQVWLFTM